MTDRNPDSTRLGQTVPEGLRTALADRYEIEGEIGQGGMATVFLAHDLKHTRRVAIKVLRAELAARVGPERFLREIRVTAQLQHPHILTLIDSGEAGGFLYYVMPYIAGQNVRVLMDQEGQMALDEVVRITQAVASALDYAHRQHVIHRDIKPENILLSDGVPMLADFGIALAAAAEENTRLTDIGRTLGTPDYMSPEQAAADRALDGRSDQYSLACVVYEMLAGEPPFTGRSAQAVMAKRMSAPAPSVRHLRPTVPESMDAAIRRALSRAPADRFPTVGAFADALTAAGWITRLHHWSIRRLAVVMTAVVVLASIVLLAVVLRRPAPVPVATQQQLTFTGTARTPAISPDGKTVAYVSADTALMVQDLRGSTGPLVIATRSFGIRQVQWSPDGSNVLFSSQVSPEVAWTAVFQVSRIGGQIRQVADTTGYSATGFFDLAPDGAALARSRGDAIRIENLRTGQVADTLEVPAEFVLVLRWSPKGNLIAFTALEGPRLFLGVVSPERKQSVRLVEGLTSAGWIAWAPSGDAIYYRREITPGGDLMRIPVNPGTGEAMGPPALVLSGASVREFAVSPDGRSLVYSRSAPDQQIWGVTMNGPGGPTRTEQLTTGTAVYRRPDISPDGWRVAYARLETGPGGDSFGNIFVQPFGPGAPQQITNTPADESAPQWSADGKRLAFVAIDSANAGLFVTDLAGDPPRRLSSTPFPWWGDIAWTPDGRRLAHSSASLTRLGLLDLASQSDSLITAPDPVRYVGVPVFSPDGREMVVAVRTHESSWQQLWRVSLADGSWKLFAGPAGNAVPLLWSRDGYIYAAIFGTANPELWRFSARSGAAERYASLPVACSELGGVALSADARRLVCAVTRAKPDLWVARQFDPRLR
jgi:serine/threonine-protein kinase